MKLYQEYYKQKKMAMEQDIVEIQIRLQETEVNGRHGAYAAGDQGKKPGLVYGSADGN
ncbi:hypothetical protein GZH47_31905 (plasmid) [Paenibacillus rhizovicinus]|uniref:Uncharacterized protein n=1 Tax=Paenibacillus rhizovicinus TaxID=2704463 RepID=A0A6C0PA70_9BACL|nr:hypothetical protein [Paenibacillus rhizovicinus]QHW35500.1 hypothetical protein GZH47_31905 [Paenibacillus rhizovicinus]